MEPKPLEEIPTKDLKKEKLEEVKAPEKPPIRINPLDRSTKLLSDIWAGIKKLGKTVKLAAEFVPNATRLVQYIIFLLILVIVIILIT
jgi:hypothetical protein